MNGHRPIEVAAGHGAAFPLAKGQAARLINTHGTQVVDCWAWNAADLSEHMSMEASRVFTQRLNPIIGDSFVTTRRRPILTLVEDTSPGIHDTFMAACDAHRYELLGVKTYHRNCLDNMMEAMRAIGHEPPVSDPRLVQCVHEYRGRARRPYACDARGGFKPRRFHHASARRWIASSRSRLARKTS